MRWQKPENALFVCHFSFRFLALLLLIFATAWSNADDFQSWNEVDIAGSWKNVDFLVPLLARVDSALPNPQLAATGITADFPLRWHLSATAGYLFAMLPRRSVDVHVPLLAVTESFRVRHLAFADRNRFEKLIGFGTSPVRYRNRFLVDRSFGSGESWHVFASDEAFFNLSAGTWNQNRLQLGAGARLSSQVLLDVYYLQRNANGPPVTRVFGTTLRVNLHRRKDTRLNPGMS